MEQRAGLALTMPDTRLDSIPPPLLAHVAAAASQAGAAGRAGAVVREEDVVRGVKGAAVGERSALGVTWIDKAEGWVMVRGGREVGVCSDEERQQRGAGGRRLGHVEGLRHYLLRSRLQVRRLIAPGIACQMSQIFVPKESDVCQKSPV